MTDSGKTITPPDVERRLNQHLEAIDRALAARGMAFSERRSVTGDVESQIREMLAARAANPPTLADVDAVLTELDPPESYATADALTSTTPVAPTGPTRFSRTAILGALWTPWLFVILVLMFAMKSEVHTAPQQVWLRSADGGNRVEVESTRDDTRDEHPNTEEKILRLTVLPLGLASPLGTTILGIVALGQIRRSNGRLTGRGLALFDALFYPLLLIDGLLWMLTYYAYAIMASWHNLGTEAFSRPSYSVADENMGLIFAIGALLSIVVDYLIVRRIWRSGQQD